MRNQKERIIAYMERFGSITTAQAFIDLGVSRLSARIFDIKEDGYAIDEEWVTAKNRFGEDVTFKKFSLKKGDN